MLFSTLVHAFISSFIIVSVKETKKFISAAETSGPPVSGIKPCQIVKNVGYVMDRWISERCMYVAPIRLDLLLNTNQISCCKLSKWYVRRFDPDTVQNGHIYSSIKEEEVFIYWVYFIFYGLG